MVTCFLRYVIEPSKVEEFEHYAKLWIPLVERFGGQHHGYFLPSEGASNVALALFSLLVAVRPALLAVGCCGLRGLLAGVAAWHVFRLRYGRCGQPERGGGKQRDHNSWIFHCVFSHSVEWPRSGTVNVIVGDAI